MKISKWTASAMGMGMGVVAVLSSACGSEDGRRRRLPPADAGQDAPSPGAGGAPGGAGGGRASGGAGPSGGAPGAGGVRTDGGRDAARDSSADATADAGGADGSSDASHDGSPDALTDGAPDAARDAGITRDAASPDASADAPGDATAGPPPPTVYDPTAGVTPDLACPAWGVTDTATPEDPVVTNGMLITSTDVLSETMTYHLVYSQTVTTAPETVVLEIDARFVSKTTPGARTGSMLGFQLEGGTLSQTFFIDDGEIYLLQDSALGKGPGYAAPTSDRFHTYRLEADRATRALRVYRDGVLVITHTAIAVNPLYPVFFGDGTSGGAGTTEWRRISHNLVRPGLCDGGS